VNNRMLRQVLLDYLQASRVFCWPGADGLTVDDILNCYPQAIAAGEVPDCRELCRRHPDLIPALWTFWAGKGWLENAFRKPG
jgi:hypothetical protein